MEAEMESYLCNIEELKKYIMENGNVEVMDLPQLRFASFDHIVVDGIF